MNTTKPAKKKATKKPAKKAAPKKATVKKAAPKKTAAKKLTIADMNKRRPKGFCLLDVLDPATNSGIIKGSLTIRQTNRGTITAFFRCDAIEGKVPEGTTLLEVKDQPINVVRRKKIAVQ